MVSFQCEGCGDILTKKKLDNHSGRCGHGGFTCLDCHQNFGGRDYRSHTSCISEAQKYEGHLYKEKPSKSSKSKKVAIAEPAGKRAPPDPYVEDAPDEDDVRPKYEVPPPAPSPPRPSFSQVQKKQKKKSEIVNPFDFIETEDGTNASKISLKGSAEQMKMVPDAPKLFDAPKELARFANEEDEPDYDVAYAENGVSWGAGPVPASLSKDPSDLSEQMISKYRDRYRDRLGREHDRIPKLSRINSDKKRKRAEPDTLVTPANRPIYENDTHMMDVVPSTNPRTPAALHTGLTGGLDRMVMGFSSPERDYPHPISPIKRSRRGDGDGESGLGISFQDTRSKRGGSVASSGTAGANKTSGKSNAPAFKGLLRTQRGSPGAEKEPSVHSRKHKHHSEKSSKSKRKSGGSLITNDDNEWHDHEDRLLRHHSPRSGSGSKTTNLDYQLVDYKHGEGVSEHNETVMRHKANQFLSLVNKGPESERGCSMHKILKKFHRDQPSSVVSQEAEAKEGSSSRGRRKGRIDDKERKDEEEQNLWKMLRLKKNDRGEIVVFLNPGGA